MEEGGTSDAYQFITYKFGNRWYCKSLDNADIEDAQAVITEMGGDVRTTAVPTGEHEITIGGTYVIDNNTGTINPEPAPFA